MVRAILLYRSHLIIIDTIEFKFFFRISFENCSIDAARPYLYTCHSSSYSLCSSTIFCPHTCIVFVTPKMGTLRLYLYNLKHRKQRLFSLKSPSSKRQIKIDTGNRQVNLIVVYIWIDLFKYFSHLSCSTFSGQSLLESKSLTLPLVDCAIWFSLKNVLVLVNTKLHSKSCYCLY